MSDFTALVDDIYREILEHVNRDILYKKNKQDFTNDLKEFINSYEKEKNIKISQDQKDTIKEDLINDLFGFGPLEHVLYDPDVTEIMVNHPNKIYVEKKGIISLTPYYFRNNEHIVNVARRIATLIHRHIDNATPLLDARLPDGSRVNVVLGPISLDSPCITIRKFSADLLDINILVEIGSLTKKMARFLEICTYCGVNIIVGGGTGAGKTTFLNILSQMIHPDERVITIEDSAELQLKSHNLIRLETRSANAEGKGEIVIHDLIKNCLRMRPDRIIVGEVRGNEVFEMLKVLNTGHDGSMSTLHCNSAHAALLRLENMVATSNPGIPSSSIRSQISSAIDIIVYVKRFRDGKRCVTEIMDVCKILNGEIQTNHFFQYKITGQTKDKKIVGEYAINNSADPSFIEKIRAFNLENDLMDCLS